DPVVSINTRYRDIGRKYISGSKKRVVEKVKKVEAKKERDSLNKYFRKTISLNAETQVEPQHSEDDSREGNKSEEVTLGNQSSYPLTESAMSHSGKLDNNNQVYSSVDITVGTSEVRETGNLKLAYPLELTDDPATWPEMM
ncbi:hypothetical protein AVEN_117081-1, partial [Araneus ventricosus]